MKFINYDLIKKGAFSFILAGSLAGSSIALSGCGATPTTTMVNQEDMMETTVDGTDITNIPKTHRVPVQVKENDEKSKFDLIITYSTDEKEWRSSDNRNLSMKFTTEGLADKYELYIDNIHTDTSLVSTKLDYNGINVDTMDDRIHNSIDRGFPVANDNRCEVTFSIEGQGESITKMFHTESSSRSVTNRVNEEQLLASGVYANEINSIITLIIVNKETNEVTYLDVQDVLHIKVNPIIEYSNGTYREYAKDGTYAVKTK